jgi:transglutaminase-like putative cysteine protease
MPAAILLLCLALHLLPAPQPVPEQPTPQAPAPAEYEVFYHHTLKNTTIHELKDVRIYIPVPESDSSQQVFDFRIERTAPVSISNRTDPFGTKLKRLQVASLVPGAEIDVGFSCTVRLPPPPKITPDPAKAAAPDALDQIPADIRALYTRDHPIFGLASEPIRAAAAKLLKDHPNPVDRARAIHDLVASTLKYEAGGGWDPAPAVLERRRGSCSEFCYVFCALCRATGIPTRFTGATIFPAQSKAPFDDRGHHRWAQAYLPGHGWVDFDPTLDAGKPPRQTFVGTHHARTLVLTRTGDKSLQLGLSYLGANSHTGETSRTMRAVWSQGTMATLAQARAALDKGDTAAATATLERLTREQPGTRAAAEAQVLLHSLPRPDQPK